MQRLLIIVFLFCSVSVKSQRGYVVQYEHLAMPKTVLPPVQTNFNNQNQATSYIAKLNSYLRSKGFITANVDSVQYKKDAAIVQLYWGAKYVLDKVKTDNIPFDILVLNGWDLNAQRGIYTFEKIYNIQTRLLDYYQENGYPFTKVSIDSIQFVNGDTVTAVLKVDTALSYRIDSIRNLGKAKIKPRFLQQYLSIKNGSLYKKSSLEKISKKINQLPYISESQPYSLSMLNSAAVVNLYLQPKKSSIVNVLLGVIPAPNPNGLTNAPKNKLFLSGDVNILLNNSFTFGETIGLIYQQLSINSRRINIVYKHPYIFKSNYGIESQFELYKRDSSFINTDVNVGMRYSLGENKNGKLFLQQLATNVFPDTSIVKATKRLPSTLDVSIVNIGVQLDWNTTNDLRTPTKGSFASFTSAFGRKNISKSSAIVSIKSNSFNYAALYDSVKLNTYRIKLNFSAAYYKPFGKQSVLKLGIQSGYLQSQNYLRNELFQIGGFKTLRGFDEESQFCNQYVVPTIEWRYLIGVDSYFFGFIDGGYTKNSSFQNVKHTYVGTGAGMSFGTKTGIFNLSVAVGARDDIPMSFKQSKLHFGYVSVF